MRVLSSAGWSTRVHLPLLGAGASAKPTAGGVSPRRRDRDWPRTQKRRAGTERRNSTAGPHLHDPPRPGQPAAASPRHSPATASLSQPAPPSSRATYSVLKWAAKSRSSIQKTPTAEGAAPPPSRRPPASKQRPRRARDGAVVGKLVPQRGEQLVGPFPRPVSPRACVLNTPTNLTAGKTVLLTVFRAPREYHGEEDSEDSGIRPNTWLLSGASWKT